MVMMMMRWWDDEDDENDEYDGDDDDDEMMKMMMRTMEMMKMMMRSGATDPRKLMMTATTKRVSPWRRHLQTCKLTSCHYFIMSMDWHWQKYAATGKPSIRSQTSTLSPGRVYWSLYQTLSFRCNRLWWLRLVELPQALVTPDDTNNCRQIHLVFHYYTSTQHMDRLAQNDACKCNCTSFYWFYHYLVSRTQTYKTSSYNWWQCVLVVLKETTSSDYILWFPYRRQLHFIAKSDITWNIIHSFHVSSEVTEH